MPSPLAPESDEEKTSGRRRRTKPRKPAGRRRKPPTVTIDFDDIGQRILALPIPARNYVGLAAAKPGMLFRGRGRPADWRARRARD